MGGLAVGARAEPRFTRDVDLVVDVADDREAERIARCLQGTGYHPIAVLEHDSGRLATVRLASPGDHAQAVVIDLLFASSGVEAEVAASAEQLEYLTGLVVPVAQRGDLIALKILARDDQRRPQDLVDLRALLAVASTADLQRARALLELITQRGYHRGKELLPELDGLLRSTPRS